MISEGLFAELFSVSCCMRSAVPLYFFFSLSFLLAVWWVFFCLGGDAGGRGEDFKVAKVWRGLF